MAYVPNKKKYKIRWQTALPLFILLCLVLYFVVGGVRKLMVPEQDRFTICGLSQSKTKAAFEKKNDEIQTISDYLFYGENLSFYGEDYYPNTESTDPLVGKTVLLYNMCEETKEGFASTMYQEPDRGIDLGMLEPGFYRLEVLDNLVHRDVVYDESFRSEPFYTAPRNGVSKKVTMIADGNILSDYDIQEEHNYVYLMVESTEPEEGMIDVLIDPYGYNIDGASYSLPDEGVSANGLVENQEMWFAAEKLKSELESYGLRVEITKKNQNDVVETYGKAGRLAKGYDKKAKYYIQLVAEESTDLNQRGISITYPSQSTNGLASNIVYNMGIENSALTFINSSSNNPGIRQSQIILTPGLDGRVVYDSSMFLRESGGKASMAGIFSETSVDKNASFAKDNLLGMQGISVSFGYFTNSEDATYWSDNKDSVVQEFAKSFVKSIGVLVEENK